MLIAAALIVARVWSGAGSPRPVDVPGPRPLHASGRVVRLTGRDTVIAPGAQVILHRVTVSKSGPIDSSHADARGRFDFPVVPDTGAVYLVSARWQGVEYFAAPVDLRGDRSDTGMMVVVSDTSSRAPIRLVARHLIVSPVDSDGMRDVVDLFVITNPGPATRVSRDSLHPTWAAALSPYAVNIHGGNSDFSLSAMALRGDTVALYAPIPPGQRNLEFDYQIPPRSREFAIPVDESAPVSNIVSSDRSIAVRGSYARDDTIIDGKPYARWKGSLAAGTPVLLEFGGTATPRWLIPLLLVVMGLALIAVTVIALRRRDRARS